MLAAGQVLAADRLVAQQQQQQRSLHPADLILSLII